MEVIKRKSWDTSVKHYVRNGLFDSLPSGLQNSISSSNRSRWKNEPEDKYVGCEVAKYIKQELDLIKRISSSSRQKKLNEAYNKLSDTFHFILNQTKGIKAKINRNKELVINAIDHVKDIIPIDQGLRIFNISRAAYQNYKTSVINTCNESYFLTCLKKNPKQLLNQEIETIKSYMSHVEYQFWSKSSIYYRALRDKKILFSLSTWYKYCNLLGFINKPLVKKSDSYDPLVSEYPNQYWCSDVTVFKLQTGRKLYIHLLADHFSKKILGYRIEKSVSSQAIKEILQEAIQEYAPTDDLNLLTDGGSEFVNYTIKELTSLSSINHLIAQRDIVSSNSMIEAINKVIKHQFLYPLRIATEEQLRNLMPTCIESYNEIRPQQNLNGYTPNEAYDGLALDHSVLTIGFKQQRALRVDENKKNRCQSCR